MRTARQNILFIKYTAKLETLLYLLRFLVGCRQVLLQAFYHLNKLRFWADTLLSVKLLDQQVGPHNVLVAQELACLSVPVIDHVSLLIILDDITQPRVMSLARPLPSLIHLLLHNYNNLISATVRTC